MGKKHSLLIVDDERDLVDQLYDYFRKDFTVYKAYDGEEAVNIFNENEIHLVMADQKMPGMHGPELLATFKEKKPEVTRILMTGFTDIEVAIDAINNESIYRYLQKPLDFDELVGIIEEGLQVYERWCTNAINLMIANEKGATLRRVSETCKEIITHKTAILQFLLEQCLLHEEVECQINEHKQVYHIRVLDRLSEQGKGMDDNGPSQYTPFTYLKKGQCLLLGPLVLDEVKAQINDGDRLLLRFFTGHSAYEACVPFEKTVYVHGKQVAIQVGFPTQLEFAHVRKHIRVKALVNSNVKLTLRAENIGDFKPHIINLSTSGLSCCLTDLLIEKLFVHSRIRLSIGVMGENNLNIDGVIRHFAEMTECDCCREKLECDEKFGPLKIICGVNFTFTDSFHEMRIDDLMFFIQKEYLMKEKEDLLRVNQELEKQVKGKTGQRREQDIQLLERQLVQADKMASIGVMVAGVAHELNNPLSIAIGDIHLVTRDIRDLLNYINYLSGLSLPSDVSEDIERQRKEIDIPFIIDSVGKKLSRCKDAAERAKEIVQRLKDFSRLDKGDKVVVDINKGIESTLQVIPKSIKRNMNITTKLAPLPEILCYGMQINQVFLNMITNACHAMGNGGELKIETSADDNYIYTKFCDNGHGIPEETMNQIFDPFFTTKKVGEGTGLGLSISYSIIEKHGGNITVANNDDKGVTFTIKLLKEGVK